MEDLPPSQTLDELINSVTSNNDELKKIIDSGIRQAIREMAKKAATKKIADKDHDTIPIIKEMRKAAGLEVSQKTGDFILMTFNPDHDDYQTDPTDFYEQFRDLKFKVKDQDVIQFFVMAIERHASGKCHFHIFMNRRSQDGKPVKPTTWRRTMAKFYRDPKNAQNPHTLNIISTDTGSLGYVAGDKEESKMEAVKADRLWRRERGISDIFIWGRGPTGTRYPLLDAAIHRYESLLREINFYADGSYDDMSVYGPEEEYEYESE